MSRTAAFRQIVRDYMRRTPDCVSPDTRCDDAVVRMAEAGAGSVVVVDRDGVVCGIVTEQDIVRRVAFKRDGDTPVAAVMTTPVRTIGDRDFLFHAIAVMRRSRLRHMPALDAAGAVVGVLNLHEALAAASSQLVGLIDRLTHEETLAGLEQVKAAQVEVAEALFGDKVPAPEIQILLSDINLDIHRRIIALALADMAEAGWGEPPVDFAAIILGSGGRGESFLFPDQDNGFILADYPDDDHGRIDPFFIELADRMTVALDTVGIPLCRGNVMATNPVWRKTISQWRDQIDIWMRRRSDVAIRLADIFFDFRPVFGKAELAAALRDHVTAKLAENPTFLREMYGLEADHRVALGLFGRLQTERREADDGDTIDLKYGGTLPLVEGVRLFALRAGVAETSTLARIAALRAADVLKADEEDYLTGAFRLITELLLRQQLADFKADRRVGNLVPENALSRRERDMLVDCFRAIRRFRDRIKFTLTGDLF